MITFSIKEVYRDRAMELADQFKLYLNVIRDTINYRSNAMCEEENEAESRKNDKNLDNLEQSYRDILRKDFFF